MNEIKNGEYFVINTFDNTMYFSLAGDEKAIAKTLKFALSYFYQNKLSVYERIVNEQLIDNSVKVIKGYLGEKATYLDYLKFLQNSGGIGRKYAIEFSKMPDLSEIEWKIHADLTTWFMDEYFNENVDTYEKCVALRYMISQMKEI